MEENDRSQNIRLSSQEIEKCEIQIFLSEKEKNKNCRWVLSTLFGIKLCKLVSTNLVFLIGMEQGECKRFRTIVS